MTKQNQNGSLHLVLMIVVIVGIVGALSFVFWKNFIDKDIVPRVENKQAGQVVEDAPEEKILVGQIDSLFPASLTWNYPEDWSIESKGNGPHSETESTMQTITLSSPSGNYQVVYQIGANGGLGGTCDPQSAGKIHYIRKEPVNGFDNTFFVEYIKNIDPWDGISGEQDPDKYTYRSLILSDRAGVQQAQEGSSFCNIYLAEVISLSDTYDTRLLAAEIKVKSLDVKEEQSVYARDIDEIKVEYEDVEYKQAVNILLSTRKN